ncbi:Chromosome partition protein Smc [bacterium HR27]|nr:Chromosome partition protein Smc [bacterium HR27]
MAFTVQDFEDLVRLLELHPEWRAQLRRLLLTEELLVMPERLARVEQLLVEQAGQLQELRRIAEEHTRQLEALRHIVEGHTQELRELRAIAEEHTRQLQEHTRELRELRRIAEEHTRQLQEHTQQLQEHTQQLRELRAIAEEHTRQLQEHTRQLQEHTKELQELRRIVEEHTRQLLALTREVGELREAVRVLEERLDRLSQRVDAALGQVFELRAQQRLSSWLGRLVRGMRVRPPGEWEQEFRARLGDEAFDRLLDADLLVRGRLRNDDAREVWLVVEVSWVIDLRDVDRVLEWAALLRAAGLTAVPVVLGSRLTDEARLLAQRDGVLVEADEQSVRSEGWERVQERWVA